MATQNWKGEGLFIHLYLVAVILDLGEAEVKAVGEVEAREVALSEMCLVNGIELAKVDKVGNRTYSCVNMCRYLSRNVTENI
jgi:hypothetical protein